MHYFQAQELQDFIQQQAPEVYALMQRNGQLEEYLWQSWLWITTEQARAAQEALSDSDLTERASRLALAGEAARCSTEISLAILADELDELRYSHASNDDAPAAASA